MEDREGGKGRWDHVGGRVRRVGPCGGRRDPRGQIGVRLYVVEREGTVVYGEAR